MALAPDKETKELLAAAVFVLEGLSHMDAMDKDVDLPHLEQRLDRAVKDFEFAADWDWDMHPHAAL
jgi:hypothetical protein